jgi:two-component system, cell cycle response regulator
MNKRPLILIVDDEPLNVNLLEQELQDLDYDTLSAADGREALQRVQDHSPDLVLLDIMMPHIDGFEVLSQLKAAEQWQHIPVVIISAISDMESIVRGIRMGAEDYLPKPFETVLLQARLSNSLEKKRHRDLELEYLEQVQHVMDAAAGVEAGNYEPGMLDTVRLREDELGQLARSFHRMADEVRLREESLKQQIQALRIEVDQSKVQEEVDTITESKFFQELTDKAKSMRDAKRSDKEPHD